MTFRNKSRVDCRFRNRPRRNLALEATVRAEPGLSRRYPGAPGSEACEISAAERPSHRCRTWQGGNCGQNALDRIRKASVRRPACPGPFVFPDKSQAFEAWVSCPCLISKIPGPQVLVAAGPADSWQRAVWFPAIQPRATRCAFPQSRKAPSEAAGRCRTYVIKTPYNWYRLHLFDQCYHLFLQLRRQKRKSGWDRDARVG